MSFALRFTYPSQEPYRWEALVLKMVGLMIAAKLAQGCLVKLEQDHVQPLGSITHEKNATQKVSASMSEIK
jgi:hypothetical protein